MSRVITPGKRLELLGLASLPGLMALGLTIFFLAAKHIRGLDQFMPLLQLAPVFYWGMLQAREMPYWFVFLLGLVTDAVTGMPLGLSSLLYIFFLALLHAQRKYVHKEGFVVKWGYFAALMAVLGSLNWILLSLFHSRAMSFEPAFLQWFLTVCCYPFLHNAFDGMQDYMHSRRWHVLHDR